MDAEYGKDALPGDFLKDMFVILYTCIYAFFQGYNNLPDTFLGQLKCHLYFFASRQVDNSICLNIVLTLCL